MAGFKPEIVEIDSSNNDSFVDVLGNKMDNSFLTQGEKASILAFAKAGYFHAHGTPILYPENSDFITVTSDSAAWTHGSKVEIIPAGSTAKGFDLHWAVLSDISANGKYNLKIYKGLEGAEVELCTAGFARSTNQAQEGSKRIQVPQIAAGERISISLSDSTTSAQTVDVALEGHLYDN